VECIQFLINVRLSKWDGGASSGHAEALADRSVASQDRRDDLSFGRACGQDGCARTVAKKHAGIPIFPINEITYLISGDDEDLFINTGSNEGSGGFHSVEKAGAGGGQIETHGSLGAEDSLKMTRDRGAGAIRSHRGHNDHIDFRWRDIRIVESMSRRSGSHFTCRFVHTGDSAFFDPGARRDPFIAGVHHRFEVSVGQDSCRKVASCAYDGCGPDG
jgi:hypothetical protein